MILIYCQKSTSEEYISHNQGFFWINIDNNFHLNNLIIYQK